MTGVPDLQMFVDGKWTAALNGRTFTDRNPWDGAALASLPAGDADDASEAIDAAARAFPSWSATTPAERQQIFLDAAALVRARAADIRHLLTVETGCSGSFADVQIAFATALFRQAGQLAYAPAGEVLGSDLPGTRALDRKSVV